jgi:hypothetical protein
MRHVARVGDNAFSGVKKLPTWLAAIAEGKVTFRDFRMNIVRRIYLREQQHYNFYIKKYKFLDERKHSGNVTVVLLAGAHDYAWRVVFRRLYEYSGDLDVIVINPGGLKGELCMKLSKDYGWSYFESFPNNITAAENFVLKNIVVSDKIIKMDDDVLITKNTFKNILRAYNILKEEGIELGFLAPVLNVNNVSYYYFLKTLNLIEEYAKLFEKPHIYKHWSGQKIWYDARAAVWIWEHSIPLNTVAEIFEKVNKDYWVPIPVRFSISLILFEKDFILKNTYGLVSPSPRIAFEDSRNGRSYEKAYMIPYTDEISFNYYSDVLKRARVLILDSFAGHLAYGPQKEFVKKWFLANEKRLLEDL